MKKETKKKTISKEKKTLPVKKREVVKSKTKKAISKKVILKKVSPKKASKKIITERIIKIPVKKTKTVALRKQGEIVKKASYKISSEFAILVILIVAGTFAFVFWKETRGGFFPDNSASIVNFPGKIKMVESKSETNEGWKIFRSESDGNEFSLPKEWKMIEEESVNKFISESNPEEIVIVNKENKDYSAEDLMEDVLKRDKEANVKLLDSQKGIIIEKRKDNIIEQTAKIILEDKVAVVTYSTYGSENNGFFLDEVVPTFKVVNKKP